jgi:hypothetical protein
MSEVCRWLHEQLEQLELIRFPFNLHNLPANAVYFFYEDGETWGHGVSKPRIVRVGTHRDGNFRSRVKEHFLLDESRMNFDAARSAPHDRSIFRKNIGRALLNKDHDGYLQTWNIDFMTRNNREVYGHLRNIEKEKEIESEITKILRTSFSFRYLRINDHTERKDLEASLIGTLGRCESCNPSKGWLGTWSPIEKIRESGLWLFQHLNHREMDEREKGLISKAVQDTKLWSAARA